MSNDNKNRFNGLWYSKSRSVRKKHCREQEIIMIIDDVQMSALCVTITNILNIFAWRLQSCKMQDIPEVVKRFPAQGFY